MNWLDVVGASLSLISTYHFTKSYHSAWIIGIFAIVLNTILYWQKGVYGHVLLECIYFVIMIIGLMKWKSNNNTTVYQLSTKQMLIASSIAFSLFLSYAYFLIAYTPSTIPYWDASTTVLCLFAQAMMIYRIIQCWMIWFVVDAMIVILQWQQGMPFHSIVTFIYLGLAILGFLRWKKDLLHPVADKLSFSIFSSKNNSVSS